MSDKKAAALPARFTFKLDLLVSVKSVPGLTVDDKEWERRLDLCRSCDRRDGEYCTCCKCPAGVHARRRHSECWLRKW
jgi:hypothetical protein